MIMLQYMGHVSQFLYQIFLSAMSIHSYCAPVYTPRLRRQTTRNLLQLCEVSIRNGLDDDGRKRKENGKIELTLLLQMPS